MHRDGTFISCTLTAERCENVQERPNPPHEHISPATGKERDSGLCRSFMMEGKSFCWWSLFLPKAVWKCNLGTKPSILWKTLCGEELSQQWCWHCSKSSQYTARRPLWRSVFTPNPNMGCAGARKTSQKTYSMGLHILYIHCMCPAPQFGIDSTNLPEHKSWCVIGLFQSWQLLIEKECLWSWADHLDIQTLFLKFSLKMTKFTLQVSNVKPLCVAYSI